MLLRILPTLVSLSLALPSFNLNKLQDYNVPLSDLEANQYIAVLNDCNALNTHITSLVKNEIQVLRTFEINNFCAYLFYASSKLSFQQNDQTGPDYILSQFKSPSMMNLLASDDIKYVVPNHRVSISATQQNAPWHLARVSSRTMVSQQGPYVYDYDDNSGFGVDAYVLDTGILAAHVEFGGRASVGAEFVDSYYPYFDGLKDVNVTQDDPNGHGTHVAGIIGSKTYGVAKEVTLIGVKVLFADGSGAWSNIIAGIQWAMGNIIKRGRPSVINISISGPPSRALEDVISAVVDQGVIVSVAAGNDQMDACSASPSNIKKKGVFVVGSVNSYDEFSSFSNYGPCVNILAPGEAIQSTYTNPRGYPVTNEYTAYISGTSQATPHVSGVVALYLSNYTLDPATLYDSIMNEATKDKVQVEDNTINTLVFADSKLGIHKPYYSN